MISYTVIDSYTHTHTHTHTYTHTYNEDMNKTAIVLHSSGVITAKGVYTIMARPNWANKFETYF